MLLFFSKRKIKIINYITFGVKHSSGLNSSGVRQGESQGLMTYITSYEINSYYIISKLRINETCLERNPDPHGRP